MIIQVIFRFWWVVFATSNMKIAESFDLCVHGVKQKKRKCWPLQGTWRVSAATMPYRQIASQCWWSILTTGMKILIFCHLRFCFSSRNVQRRSVALCVRLATAIFKKKRDKWSCSDRNVNSKVFLQFKLDSEKCTCGSVENLYFVINTACNSASSPAFLHFCIKG